MMPEQVVQAATDLKAERLMPVHWSKFSLALHPWDESITTVSDEAVKQDMPLLTPMIGKKTNLNEMAASREQWWKWLN